MFFIILIRHFFISTVTTVACKQKKTEFMTFDGYNRHHI